jgi:hypothetical protein
MVDDLLWRQELSEYVNSSLFFESQEASYGVVVS